MSHTPGPWTAMPFNSRSLMEHGKPIFEDGLWFIMRESNPELLPICIVDRANDHHPPTREKAERDARLIAAAPDLLRSLKSIIAKDDGDEPFAWKYPEVFEAARTAIAKAERK